MRPLASRHFHSSKLLGKGRHGGSTGFDSKTPRGPSKQQRKRKVKKLKEIAVKNSAMEKNKQNKMLEKLKPKPEDMEKSMENMEKK